jgi:acyl carrier protein
MDIRETIIELFDETLETTNSKRKSELTDETVLLDSGLDSLGFAILVARLEEELGYDPFSLMEEAVYPTKFVEFVAIYEKFQSNNS